MSATPATLLERLRKGTDPDAWARFVELYTPVLLTWARRLGLSEHEAGDLVQDVFVHLVQKLPSFVYDHQRSFRAWLKTVAHNLWRNQFARKRPGIDGSINLDKLPEREAEAFWEVEYRRHLLDRALAVMQAEFGAGTWRACWETVVHGRSAEEVGTQLGLSAAGVRSAKFRVLNRLRRELGGLLD